MKIENWLESANYGQWLSWFFETKLRPPKNGSDNDTNYTAGRLCEIARDLLSDASLVNRLQDVLNGQGGLAEPMRDPGITDAELAELQH